MSDDAVPHDMLPSNYRSNPLLVYLFDQCYAFWKSHPEIERGPLHGHRVAAAYDAVKAFATEDGSDNDSDWLDRICEMADVLGVEMTLYELARPGTSLDERGSYRVFRKLFKRANKAPRVDRGRALLNALGQGPTPYVVEETSWPVGLPKGPVRWWLLLDSGASLSFESLRDRDPQSLAVPSNDSRKPAPLPRRSPPFLGASPPSPRSRKAPRRGLYVDLLYSKPPRSHQRGKGGKQGDAIHVKMGEGDGKGDGTNEEERMDVDEDDDRRREGDDHDGVENGAGIANQSGKGKGRREVDVNVEAEDAGKGRSGGGSGGRAKAAVEAERGGGRREGAEKNALAKEKPRAEDDAGETAPATRSRKRKTEVTGNGAGLSASGGAGKRRRSETPDNAPRGEAGGAGGGDERLRDSHDTAIENVTETANREVKPRRTVGTKASSIPADIVTRWNALKRKGRYNFDNRGIPARIPLDGLLSIEDIVARHTNEHGDITSFTSLSELALTLEWYGVERDGLFQIQCEPCERDKLLCIYRNRKACAACANHHGTCSGGTRPGNSSEGRGNKARDARFEPKGILRFYLICRLILFFGGVWPAELNEIGECIKQEDNGAPAAAADARSTRRGRKAELGKLENVSFPVGANTGEPERTSSAPRLSQPGDDAPVPSHAKIKPSATNRVASSPPPTPSNSGHDQDGLATLLANNQVNATAVASAPVGASSTFLPAPVNPGSLPTYTFRSVRGPARASSLIADPENVHGIEPMDTSGHDEVDGREPSVQSNPDLARGGRHVASMEPPSPQPLRTGRDAPRLVKFPLPLPQKAEDDRSSSAPVIWKQLQDLRREDQKRLAAIERHLAQNQEQCQERASTASQNLSALHVGVIGVNNGLEGLREYARSTTGNVTRIEEAVKVALQENKAHNVRQDAFITHLRVFTDGFSDVMTSGTLSVDEQPTVLEGDSSTPRSGNARGADAMLDTYLRTAVERSRKEHQTLHDDSLKSFKKEVQAEVVSLKRTGEDVVAKIRADTKASQAEMESRLEAKVEALVQAKFAALNLAGPATTTHLPLQPPTGEAATSSKKTAVPQAPASVSVPGAASRVSAHPNAPDGAEVPSGTAPGIGERSRADGDDVDVQVTPSDGRLPDMTRKRRGSEMEFVPGVSSEGQPHKRRRTSSPTGRRE
ncbi:unnamed protein product [Peniophora sp. CBMAI 1063]|nr:unnamed protein product [Peniophora sp. CBMAI 1063]